MEITRLGLGAWAIGGGEWQGGGGPQDDADSIAAIHRAVGLSNFTAADLDTCERVRHSTPSSPNSTW
ncbi:MAG: hypothetical protein QOK43_2310 [Acidimicrobiaceae bacterium]|nr:hypothetical protein [Acidimicrobiaceae bacterium]